MTMLNFGEIILAGFAFWIGFSTLIIALLARRKSPTPLYTACIGFFLSFIPVFSLLYMTILVLKNDSTDSAAPLTRDVQ